MRYSAMTAFAVLLFVYSSATDLDSIKNAKVQTLGDIKPDTTEQQLALVDVVDSVVLEVEQVVEVYFSDEIVEFEFKEIPLDEETFTTNVSTLGWEIPMDFNHLVKTQIDFFGTTWQAKLKKMITISDFYFPIYDRILAENDMPQEIKYLSIVESGLNPKARSRSGAVGPWQFMPATGRIFNLDNNYSVDERRSIEKSTQAACQYLRSMYNQFGDWYVALASYNCGPGNVRKAIRRSGRTDFWGMYNYLPRETQNYVPKFIAMAYMMNFYSDYGITPVFVENMKQAYTQVKCYDHMDFTIIAEKLEMTSEELMSYNPELKRASIPYSNNEYMLNVPYDNVYLFEMHEEEILALSLVKYEEQLAIEAAKPKVVYYYVRKGDNLLTIGRRYGVTVSQLKAWNGIRGTTIHPKQRLRIEQKPH